MHRPKRPDVSTVDTLRRLGYTVEREETIDAAVKPFSVKDQTPVDRMFLKDQIDEPQYDAAMKIKRLWRVCKTGPKGAQAVNLDMIQHGDTGEDEAIYRIEAQAELTALFGRSDGNVRDVGVLTDYECMAVISVVVFDESPRDFAHRNHRRMASGAETIQAALKKAVDLWRM